MIRAVYRDGKIQPMDKLPVEWHDGEPLEIRALGCPLETGNAATDTDDWIYERGAFANYTGEMPPHVREELERRFAALDELGPMEFEPGEKEEMERFWRDLDEVGRQDMKRILEQNP
jgi:hypothetical protein